MEALIKPTHKLFNLIYTHNKIPEQWSISKIVPIFKKGSKNDFENNRPIANLCSMTKVFQQLILKKLKDIKTEKRIDLRGNSEHGFKQKRSTAMAGLTIQSKLTRALEQNN